MPQRMSQMTVSSDPSQASASSTRVSRVILVSFLFTFIASRVLVFLIMMHVLPDLYVHVRGTHVHHLNFGIILLAAVGAWLLIARPAGKAATVAAIVYGIGLALTFDEFGMWLHLGGSYWQRASFDAVVVIAALLGLVAFAPTLKRFRPRHWATAVLLAVAIIVFAYALVVSINRAGKHIGPMFHRIEESPPQGAWSPRTLSIKNY